jgi:intracellular sulfur oxidation DsrE/DsrF family protein
LVAALVLVCAVAAPAIAQDRPVAGRIKVSTGSAFIVREGAQVPALTALMRAGVNVQADSFSLRERSIPAEALADGVVPGELDTVIDCLAAGWRVIWH